MPARGRHRRYQPHRVSRASLTVTASGAGIALPLIGAAPAHAAAVEVWEKVADCESPGDGEVNTDNGSFRGLQYGQTTWQEYGDTAHAPRVDLTPGEQQTAVAEQVLRGQGPTAWPTCATGTALVLGPDQTTPPPRVSAPSAVPASAPSKPTEGERPGAEEPTGARPQSGAPPERYTVVSGDTLFGISQRKQVDGGWQALYAHNQDTVGADPDLILPGQRLRLNGPSPDAQQRPETRTQRRTAEPERKAAPEPAEKAAERPADEPAERPAAKPSQRSAPKPEGKPADKQTERSDSHDAQRSRPQRQEKPAAPAPRFTAPVSSAPGAAYRTPGSMWSRGYHTGVDFPVGTGTSVKAIGSGQVVSAGWAGSYGYQVVVRHPDGKYSQYAHLSSIAVRTGQPVNTGQRLGRSGSTGNSTGPHLHFEIRTGPEFGSDIDPLAYLRSHGVRI